MGSCMLAEVKKHLHPGTDRGTGSNLPVRPRGAGWGAGKEAVTSRHLFASGEILEPDLTAASTPGHGSNRGLPKTLPAHRPRRW
jgi:hypothetical protein